MAAGTLRRERLGGRAAFVFLILAILASSGCLGYGGEKVESPEGKQIKSEAEHCQITLPQGWTWRPAAWAAVSPRGTAMAFEEHLYGRPQHPTWDEAKATAREQATARGATVSDEGDVLRIDFGPDGGLSVIRRFDRAGCQLTFSPKSGVRAEEQATWQQIIASLERITPTS